MKRQFLVAQLAMLLGEHSAADSAGRPSRPVSLTPCRRESPPQLDKFAMLVQPLRHRLQLAADLVSGEEIE